MVERESTYCPDCAEMVETPELDRRNFIRVLGTAAVAGVGGLLGSNRALAAPDVKEEKSTSIRPAEDLVKELFASLSKEDKEQVVLPFDHGSAEGKKMPTRLGMYNAPILGKRIGKIYSKPQQELIGKILRAIASDDEGYRRITRNGTFDSSGSIQGCGALLFGEPVEGKEWSWVFSGHHLTVRCDGRPKDGLGFGGPMYYGHSPNGYSDRNVFFYQTKSVLSVFDALDEKQRKAAIVTGTPGEQAPSIKLRAADQPKPGLACSELSKDQKALVEKVMKDILSPYRKEDVDEVMGIIKATGGLDKINLAFYRQKEMQDSQRWHFWRLEGPGIVWNFRVLPHVHTFVNITGKV